MSNSSERIWNGKMFSGTAVIYGFTTDFHAADQCDFVVSLLEETSPNEVRAFRESRRKRKGFIRPLPKRSLAGELFLIVGPDMSPDSVVCSLERLIADIRNKGLLTGRDENGDYQSEEVGRVS